MGTLKAKRLNKMKDKTFGIVETKKGKSGKTIKERKYPMPDRQHAINALARAKQMLDKGKLTRGEYMKVKRKACSLYPGLPVCKG